jgi:hypothetical protein
MSKILEHFDNEVRILKEQSEDGGLLIEPYLKPIRELVEAFSKQGHSGLSAYICSGMLVNAIEKVLNFEAIAPITGDDEEWVEVTDNLYQNKRQSGVVKEVTEDGENTYFHDGIVWKGEGKHDTFTGKVQGIKSKVKINLPIVPETFFVDVIKEQGVGSDGHYTEDENGNKYHYVVEDIEQLRRVEEYYGIELIKDMT